MTFTTYEKIIRTLTDIDARYRVLHHPPEGETTAASRLRNHALAQAAKSLVVRVAVGKRQRHYVLAVVPGHRFVDLARLCQLVGGTRAAFADRAGAERLGGGVSGSIPPISFDPDLQVIVDPEVLSHNELYFNAARLDRSIALATGDYLVAARPRVESIACERASGPTAPTVATGSGAVD